MLHVILNLGHTNGQYNEHCLPMIGKRDISIVTYFPPHLTPPPPIKLFAGDGSLKGFLRVLRAALDADEYDVIHDHAPQSGSLVVLGLIALGRILRVRSSMVYTVQDSFYDYSRRNQLLMVVALMGYRRIVFCSRAAYDSVPAVWRWAIRGRWTVVQNGADIDRVDAALAAANVRRDDSGFAVVSVARLEPVKDLETLIDAFAEAADPRSRLVLIGAGSLEGELKRRAESTEAEVVFTGLIPRDAVFLRCAGADLLVSTSHGEGLPVAVIEAMAAGCMVVLSDIAPHRELADGADFIPLVEPGDVGGFAREIATVRSMSSDQRRELGRRCREHVLARFTLPIMHAGIEEVYRSLPGVHKSTAAVAR